MISTTISSLYLLAPQYYIYMHRYSPNDIENLRKNNGYGSKLQICTDLNFFHNSKSLLCQCIFAN